MGVNQHFRLKLGVLCAFVREKREDGSYMNVGFFPKPTKMKAILGGVGGAE
jgi:hypothetical protein